MDMEKVAEVVVKGLTKIAICIGAYRLLSKAMDRRYSVSASHKNSHFSMTPNDKS